MSLASVSEGIRGPFAGTRVLDLTGESGLFAGRLLAELGADVIRVEPPGGDAVRRRRPLLESGPESERSLYHLHFNAGKRGITLDMRLPEGQALLFRLAQLADAIIETACPGRMDTWGVGYAALSALNPALVYGTLTPFGQDGPMATYRANDLVAVASSGLMSLNGFPEDPPIQPGAEQAYHMGSLALGIIYLTHLPVDGSMSAVEVCCGERDVPRSAELVRGSVPRLPDRAALAQRRLLPSVRRR